MSARKALALVTLMAMATPLLADEGMWLLDSPPRELLAKRHGFSFPDGWLDRAMKASVRFNSGGSGGFVSPGGLVVTNHHIAADALQKLTTRERDLLRDGFYASTPAKELKCPDLELNVLQEIIDVTEKVNAAVKKGMTDAQANAARRAVMSDIEKKSLDETKLRSDVVALYQGGAYHLYRYKKYTDVRLVFAPEQQIAFFGGIQGDGAYPSYNFDVCFFRAYENGQPARPSRFFRWSQRGPTEEGLVFMLGHPGPTRRQDTLAMLLHRRNHTLPYTLDRLALQERVLARFSQRGRAEAGMAAQSLDSVTHLGQVYTGQYHGLSAPAVLAAKEKQERNLREKVRGDQSLRRHDNAWEQIATAFQAFAGFEKAYYLLERGHGFDSDLFAIARHLVRLAEESKKPNGERLPEYSDAKLGPLRARLLSPTPHAELERVRLEGSLGFLARQLGRGHPAVVRVLGGKSPAERADELIAGTRLGDREERRRLGGWRIDLTWDGAGSQTVAASADPLIVLARAIDADARAVRKRYEEVEGPVYQARREIAAAQFEVLGTSVPPEPTRTLRLAFGVVRGYRANGAEVPSATTFGGAFERARGQGKANPFVLPARWLAGEDRVAPGTPLNFVSTADCLGGTSGAPLLDRAGEVVGVNFNQNRAGLVLDYVYTDEQARHIAVHSRGVLEALHKLYGAEALVKELTGK